MRFLALIFLSTLSVFDVVAQSGNTWIHFDQPYVKIPVGSNAFYRVTNNQLQSAGFPATGANVENLQLFHRGNELAIIVKDDGDGIFNNADYLEFYGTKNDGTLDKQLYQTPDLQPHNYYNLYSDTTAYFLTIGSSSGKRIQSYFDNSTGLTAESFHIENKLTLYTDEYSTGRDYGEIQLTVFDEAEGWMSSQILYNQPSRLFEIAGINHQLPSENSPMVEMVLTGRGPQSNPVSIYAGNRMVTQLTLDGYESKKISFPIEWSDINAQGKLTISVKVNGDATRASVNYIKLQYAQEIDMDGREAFNIFLRANGLGKSLIHIENPHTGTRIFDITSPENPVQVGNTLNTTLDAIVRNTTSERQLLATAQFVTPEIKKVSFRQINPNDHNYVIISHSSLRKPAGNYLDPVRAYADYRASETGGGFDTLLVAVDQLYDQFSYGEKTPVAIFNFMRFLTDTHAPEYLFIIGKGLEVYYHDYRTPDAYTFKDLIPTAGYPGSDIAFTAGMNGATYGPGVPTGRITASTPEEVAAYLNKVKETETRPFDDLRRKHVLHLSGGINPGEPQLFREYLEDVKPIAEGFHLGGHVSAVAKQSTDLKLINIADEVNKGIDLVTFFGHASPGTLDFDVGFVTNPVLGYNNKGKYPVMLMNGCDAGAFFLNTNLFGENWINTANKGAIGFIAHSSFGFTYQLRQYTQKFYEVGFSDSVFISKGVGDVQREAVRRYLASYGSGPIDITHVQNMVLLGDPAVPLFGARFPDYEIRDENLTIAPFGDDRITTATDSFAINFIIRNFGQAKNKPLKVQITRSQQGRPPVIYDSIYTPVLYSDTLTFIIRGKNFDYSGDNTFAIKVDADDDVQELRDDNNTAYIDYFIPSNNTQNLYPAKFSIINTREVPLSFQHTNLLTGERKFVLEIDSTNTFDSPFKKSFNITATVLALQPVTLLENDSVVYFWRTKIANPTDQESKDWVESTFTYINNGPPGWTQSNFAQFYEDVYTGLDRNETAKRIFFKETSTNISIKTFGINAGKPADSMSVKINNAEYNLNTQGWGCRSNALNIIAFNKSSAAPYLALPFQWFNVAGRACGREPWVINSYVPSDMVTGNNDDLMRLIDNVETGDSVVLFTMGDAHYSLWPDEAKEKLSELGISAAQLASLSDGEPVVIFARKSSPAGTARLMIPEADPTSTALKVSQTVTGRFVSGKVNSTVIGPSKAWFDFILKIREKEISDQVFVEIYGIDAKGEETLLMDSISQSTDLSGIDANTYPSIRLVYSNTDELNLTAAQLHKWFVTFEPVPEGLLYYNDSLDPVTLQAGQSWTGSYRFINIGNNEFDTAIPVSVKVFNHANHTSKNQVITIDAPPPGDTTNFKVTVNTFGFGGKNDVEVFCNPRVLREQSYGNNDIMLVNHINVTDEHLNPVLDVTIDGRYIHDGEFVSATPMIQALVWDENQFLKITDTTHMELFLSMPCVDETCDFKRVNFNQDNVTWKAATDSTYFRVNFQPATLPDGTYTLKVLATDQTGNASGLAPFEISFRVTSENKVDISDPYPNPTIGDIHFDYEVTGNETVHIDADIYTTEGLWVCHLDEHDFNDIHVGSGVLHWTPATADGQSFPAGIYIFRLQIGRPGDLKFKRGKIVIGK